MSFMMEPHQKRPIVSFRRKLLRWGLQFLIGGIFFGSALAKAFDLPGFIEILKTYEAFPASTLWPLAILVTGGELFLGVWILSGYRLVTSALLGAFINMVYAIWMAITLLRGLNLRNCGCFGVFFPQPLTWLSPIEDLVLVAICCLLAYLMKTQDSPHHRLRTNLLN